METRYPTQRTVLRVSRRHLLKAGLTAGVTLSALPLAHPPALWGAEAGQPRRGGILRMRGWDLPHFDHHLTINNYTNYVLSFVCSRLVRHKVGADVQPGTFPVEPDLAERWEALDDTTYVFHLRQGVKWHNKPPLNGRELVAEDVKFTQRYAAEQQYYVYTNSVIVTASWAPYVKNYGPNITFDYGSRAAALWLDR